MEKRQKYVFVISLTKLRQFWQNLVNCVLNKFEAKWCKHFSPHLNSVSTLPCETWNAHRTRESIELLQKQTEEFIPPRLWPQNLPDLNTVYYSMWEILQEKVYKHASLIWSYQWCHWWMAATITKARFPALCSWHTCRKLALESSAGNSRWIPARVPAWVSASDGVSCNKICASFQLWHPSIAL